MNGFAAANNWRCLSAQVQHGQVLDQVKPSVAKAHAESFVVALMGWLISHGNPLSCIGKGIHMQVLTALIVASVGCLAIAQAPKNVAIAAPNVNSLVEYGNQVRAKLQAYLMHVAAAGPDASVEVLVKMDSTGHVISVLVKQSSGTPALDAMVVAAVRRASPLPLDKGRAVPEMVFVVRNPSP